ncbi:MAG TPA: hypothetical protein DDW42_06655 [Desulfobacteraceae bacterium]|nr:hypothetical protein [Desulfobacteraceae bacterium]
MDILREGTEEQRNGLYEKELPVEMFYRDVRLYRIFEGISEIQRVVIAKNLLK